MHARAPVLSHYLSQQTLYHNSQIQTRRSDNKCVVLLTAAICYGMFSVVASIERNKVSHTHTHIQNRMIHRAGKKVIFFFLKKFSVHWYKLVRKCIELFDIDLVHKHTAINVVKCS